MANRTRTPIAAAAGTAISMPTKPNRAPKANSANISQTGCSPTEDPTSRGCRMLPLKELADGEDGDDRADHDEIRPELDNGDDQRQHEANQRSDIGNEADQAGEQADQKAEIQNR